MTKEYHAKLWTENKAALVAARRRGDESEAARLSQEREALKKHRWCMWPGCGVVLAIHSGTSPRFCMMHHITNRFHRKQLWKAL